MVKSVTGLPDAVKTRPVPESVAATLSTNWVAFEIDVTFAPVGSVAPLTIIPTTRPEVLEQVTVFVALVLQLANSSGTSSYSLAFNQKSIRKLVPKETVEVPELRIKPKAPCSEEPPPNFKARRPSTNFELSPNTNWSGAMRVERITLTANFSRDKFPSAISSGFAR